MRNLFTSIAAVALTTTLLAAPVAFAAEGAALQTEPKVEFGLMTWPEVKAALAAGKTTALIYTGGTEQRGPQNVNGGHTLLGEATVKAIALKLGNAIAMPVLPYTPNRASAELPGTIGLTNDILTAVLEQITEESIKTGFKNVVLMGDHGGGQGPLGPKNVYDTVAKKLDAKYASQGIHVYYCDQVYAPANHEFDVETEAKGYPYGAHAGLSDTSEMLYVQEGRGNNWVRKDKLATAVGTPLSNDGKETGPKVNNGIEGDARRSTAELGKLMFDTKVNYAVKQIQGFIPPKG